MIPLINRKQRRFLKRELEKSGLEVVALTDEMAGNDTYVKIYTVGGEILEILETVSEDDYSEPKAVYQISIPAESLSTLVEEMGGGGEPEEMSEALVNSVEKKMFSSLISQLNARDGAVNLAASAVCTAGKTFVNHEIKEDTIYLYTYENTAPAAVTFIRGEDGTVSATGCFLLYEEFRADSESEVAGFFETMGASVKAVTTEE